MPPPDERAGVTDSAGGLTTAVLFVLLGVLTLTNGHPNEDAYILFAYVENFVAGHGIAFYPGGPPAEGFTDLLWFLVLAALHAVGINVGLAACLVSAGAVATIAWALGRLAPGRWLWAEPTKASVFYSFVFALFAIWVAADSSSFGWGLFVFFLWPIGYPSYLIERRFWCDTSQLRQTADESIVEWLDRGRPLTRCSARPLSWIAGVIGRIRSPSITRLPGCGKANRTENTPATVPATSVRK